MQIYVYLLFSLLLSSNDVISLGAIMAPVCGDVLTFFTHLFSPYVCTFYDFATLAHFMAFTKETDRELFVILLLYLG